jgi:hypothetical protein
MKKILFFFSLFLILAKTSFAQSDTKPTDANFKNISPFSFSYYTTDNTVWIYLTSQYGWRKLATARGLYHSIDSLAALGYTKVKVDSLLSLKLNLADSLNKYITPTYLNNQLNLKVDKITGKKLSTKDYTNTDSLKLVGLNKSLYRYWTVHETYDSLLNKPTIPDISVKKDKNDTITSTGYYTNYKALSKKDKSDSTATDGYVRRDRLASTILSFKLKNDSVVGSGFYTNYKALSKKDKSDSTATDGYVRRDRLTSSLATKLNYRTFGSAANSSTSDFEPANTNIQGHIARTDNPHSVTKTQVGLANVDNTTDVGKPVSTAQQNALNLKLNLSDSAAMLAHYAKIALVNTKMDHSDSTATDGYVRRDRLTSSLATKISNTAIGANNGVASLDASGHVPLTQMDASLLGSVSYQGTYDASNNTPTLPSAVGNKGKYYTISAAGTQQSIAFSIGDWIVSNGTIWQQVYNNNKVVSVNGQLGVVTLTTANVAASTDKNYVTDAKITVLNNTTNTNSGDNAVNSLYSGLVSNVTHNGDVTNSTNAAALSVVKIQGYAIQSGAPTAGDFLRSDGTTWNHVAIVNADVPTLYKVETFAEAAAGSTGQVNTLTNTPKAVTAVQVSLNGGVLKPSQYTVSTNTVRVSIPVYQYDSVTVSYTF